jgi:hypothetical protein
MDILNHPEEPLEDSSREVIQDRIFRENAKLGIAALSAAFQQSPGNEALRAYAALSVYDHTRNPLLVGATVGAVTVAIEGLSSYSISAALNSENDTVEKLKNRFRRGDVEERASSNNRLSDVSVALGIGAGGLVVKRHLQEPSRTLKQDIKTTTKATALIAGTSASVAGLVGGGIEYAERIGLERPAEVMVNVLTDWRTYVGAFAVAQAYNYTKKLLPKLKPERDQS